MVLFQEMTEHELESIFGGDSFSDWVGAVGSAAGIGATIGGIAGGPAGAVVGAVSGAVLGNAFWALGNFYDNVSSIRY